jgi:HTH-type transcriptional regulator/antitoxin HigA
MGQIRPIRTEADYDAALARIDTLMDEPSAIDELDVLTTLVEVYEDAHFRISSPDPIEAIRFRMEQADLSQSDLAKYIGSRAKVSEVLAGKRPLTLKMVRALSAHLGIPADVLVGERDPRLQDDFADVDWSKFPVAQMANLGWIKNAVNVRDRAEEIMRDLIVRAGGAKCVPFALYRKNNSARRNARMDAYALQAWCLYVLAEARANLPEQTYQKGAIDAEFLRAVARLSVFEDGPKRAQDFLREHGIALLYARHLPKTYLDGAAMRTKEGVPVIGITLRYDRIDNFWFCLLHELVHIACHLSDEVTFFVDDLSLNKSDHDEDWDLEEEADLFAQNALIPEADWEEHAAQHSATPMNVISLAQQAGVHPAIVAGRIRKESGNYRLLTQFVGNGEVRRHFECR